MEIELDAAELLYFSATGELSLADHKLQASGRIEFTTEAELEVRYQRISGQGSLAFSTDAELEVRGQFLTAHALLAFQSSATLKVTQYLTGNGSLDFRATARTNVDQILSGEGLLTFRHCAELDAGRDGLGVCDVARHILLLWGIENPRSAPSFVRSAALDYLNAAMQIVWNQAKDRNYWTRTTQTVTLTAGTSSLALTDSIQNVIGPVRRADNKRPLVLVNTRAEIDEFEDLYLDGESSGTPVGYHIERMSQPGKEPVASVFHVAPAPELETDFLLDVVLEAPRFDWNDVNACPRVPIPHRYVESLLLPIVRYHAMSSHLFVFPDRAKQITDDYAQASAMLEAADPIPEPA